MQTRFTELTDSQWQVIENFVSDNRPQKLNLRTVLNGILQITRTGSQWRNLDAKYGNWQSVYYYFRQWKNKGIITKMLDKLVELERIRKGKKAKPSAAAVDSQSVKANSFINLDRGIDGGKLANGRKRHILVDTLGLPMAIHVSAANVSDAVGGYDLLAQAQSNDSLKLIRGDKAYNGKFAEAAGYFGWEVECGQKPPTKEGFVPQKGRWQVERTFAWLNFFRRLSKDYERKTCSSEAFIRLAYISIILARIA